MAQNLRYFNPRKIPNCKIWLAADHATLTRAAGMAGQFTAVNSESLSVASNSSLQTGDIDYTVCAWVYIDTLVSAGIVVRKSGAPNREYELDYITGTTNKFAFAVYDGTNSIGEADAATPSPASTATWYFVVAWHDSVNNQVGISVNDATPTTVATTGAAGSGTPSLEIGAIAGASFWDGRIHGVGFWKKVLTAAERTQLYNSGVGLAYDQLDPGLKTSLISYWELNEPSGTRNDLHGTNHLTDNNTVTTNPGVINNAVTTLSDLSGRGNDFTQSTQANKPVIRANKVSGKTGLLFDGTNDDLGLASNADIQTNTFTLALIYQPTNAGEAGVIASRWNQTGDQRHWALVQLVANGIDLDISTLGTDAVFSVTSTNKISSGKPSVLMLIINGATQTISLDGLSDSTSSAGTPYSSSTSTFWLARDGTGGLGANKNATFPELVFYDRVLNTREQRQLINYLAKKWGVTIT